MTLVFFIAILVSTFILMKRRKIAYESYQKRHRQGPITSPTEQIDRNTAQITKCEKLMRCFSISDNLNNLMKPRAKQGDEELEVLNGLRVMFCALIILGNTYFYILRSPLQNLEAVEQWLRSGFFSTVLSADLTVDAFFWLSAFLGSY
jgi:hypothetical protein